MNILFIVVAVAGILLYGYHLMSRLDRFLENGGFADNTAQRVDTLVLTDARLIPEMRSMQERNALSCLYISEPILPENMKFQTVFALSHNDLDNILLCRRAKKTLHAFTIAVCNNRQYLCVFHDNTIDKVVFSLREAYLALNSLRAKQVSNLDQNL